jgi:lysophospholipase L1-like esterase
MQKTVLCYGDSNTWGRATVARPDDRYGPDERWPGVMRGLLGAEWLVIEEGLNGRTTVSDDPVEGIEKNGRTYLRPCLLTYKPLDAVVIMLGTNDLKVRFNKSAWEIASGAGALVDDIIAMRPGRGDAIPEILLVCPPLMLSDLKERSDMFTGAPAKSADMPRHYREAAEARGVRFLDAGTVARSSEVDGFHLDPDAHDAIARAVAGVIAGLG